jgi:hypothetical protein
MWGLIEPIALRAIIEELKLLTPRTDREYKDGARKALVAAKHQAFLITRTTNKLPGRGPTHGSDLHHHATDNIIIISWLQQQT